LPSQVSSSSPQAALTTSPSWQSASASPRRRRGAPGTWSRDRRARSGRSGRCVGIAALAYIVVVSTLLGYGVWYRLMLRYPASTVVPFTLLVPVVGILTAWIVRGEHPTWGELLGSLIVLVGLGLALGVVDALAVHRRTAAAQLHTYRAVSTGFELDCSLGDVFGRSAHGR
jgi:EamA-like transporter family protein